MRHTRDETTQDDFVFRLVSEKEEYREGEKVKLYGEIEYIGEKEEVTIVHSSSAILISLEEKIRGYHIDGIVQDIGVTTTLKKGEPYRENYVKSRGSGPEEDPSYKIFMEDFLKRDDFPAGYYVAKGYTDFFAKSGEVGEHVNIEANVDFKVLEND
ncbi:hypothetical protein MUB24_18885 [Lederbergia sp. NSJ-179]|uniref:hypothetical protein n=1 Tax=Lederbergia sp. NSJ-179 TaxID=2931402 RepID=UPI001FD45406|nr:hypothetical protein [Lederbergia sp. NSJ-179]MCJ7842905.1 hypothetical protein [Lederbergia sp. NSJ-179]